MAGADPLSRTAWLKVSARITLSPVAADLFLQRDQPPGVPPLALTGERTLPDVPAENYWFQRHLVVYEWISRRVAGARILDMACGEGYGSAVLARTAAHVVGLDANPEAYEHARLRYTRPNVSFDRGMVENYGAPGSFDAVVFLQTIEHVIDPTAVLEHLRALLTPGGVLYVSTPNVLTLAPEGASKSENPWHVREYRAAEFQRLCAGVFADVDVLGLVHARTAAGARTRAGARLGPGASRARNHRAVLRPVHAGDLGEGFRAATRAAGSRARLPCDLRRSTVSVGRVILQALCVIHHTSVDRCRWRPYRSVPAAATHHETAATWTAPLDSNEFAQGV